MARRHQGCDQPLAGAVQGSQADAGDRVGACLIAPATQPSRARITEELLLQDDENTVPRLQQLRELGAHIVMDDFGTGYSSLNYLRRFPLDKIKIDQAFIGGLSDGNPVSVAILQAVVGIAKVLGVRTTAEGIETEEQLRLVKALGCTEMQGYLFGRPMPLEEIVQLFPAQPIGAPPPLSQLIRAANCDGNPLQPKADLSDFGHLRCRTRVN